jgi:hypothetical protein
MDIIKNAPEAPQPPIEHRHDCGRELRLAESARTVDAYRRFGMVVQCSCGIRYELRPMTFFKFVVGQHFGSQSSIYSATQYWSYLGKGRS